MNQTKTITPLSQVAEFHKAFGAPILNSTQKPTPERVALRIRLLKEEANELHEALINRDIVHAAKELADLYYVFWGAVLEFGMQSQIPISKVNSGNREPRTPLSSTSDLFITFILPNIYKLGKNPNTEDFINLRNEIDQICEIMGMGEYINEVFTEVHRSNMSKVWPDGSVRHREDGKVLKSPNYSKADIKSVLGL